MSPTVRSPSWCSCLGGALAHPPQGLDRQRMKERDYPVGRDDEQPVGLAPGRSQLRHEFGGRDPDRAGELLLVPDPRADPLGDLHRAPEPPPRSAHVEKGLVERERLHERGDGTKDLHDPGRRLAIAAEPRGDHHRLRAQPAGAHHRHRASYAELTSLVGGRQHHSPAATAADDDRLPLQLWPRSQLDGCVERVHVDVQDRAVLVRRLAHGRFLSGGGQLDQLDQLDQLRSASGRRASR